MRAVVTTDFGAASVEDVPRPDPAPDEVLIEVRRVQLSVTECQLYRGEASFAYETVRDRMRSGNGRLFGHEFAGEVVEAGPEVEAFEVGDRVYAPGKIPCGECVYCEAGTEHFCSDKDTIGFHRPGALAEYVALPEAPLCRLPGGVTDAEGAALQPLASSAVCTLDAGIETGDVVAVMGAGVMGHQCGQLALIGGANRVLAVDVDPRKVDLAAEKGMIGVDAGERDPVAAVEDETGGVGADVVFEAVGGEQSRVTEGEDPIAQSYRMVRPGGTICQVGIVTTDVSMNPRAMRSKFVRWVNPRMGRVSTGPNMDAGEHAARLVAEGRVSIEGYVTHELDGLSAFEDAIEITLDKDAHDALGPAQLVLSG